MFASSLVGNSFERSGFLIASSFLIESSFASLEITREESEAAAAENGTVSRASAETSRTFKPEDKSGLCDGASACAKSADR